MSVELFCSNLGMNAKQRRAYFAIQNLQVSNFILTLTNRNQRTNGPVNAHLIPGPHIHVSTKNNNKFDIVIK